MKRFLNKIEIKEELKFHSETFDGEVYEYNYIEVHLLDEQDNILEIWKWQTDGDIPTIEEFCERSGCKIGVSCWVTVD